MQGGSASGTVGAPEGGADALLGEGRSATSQAIAIAGIMSVQLVFATYQILGKQVLDGGLDPVAFALLRELCSCLVFLLASVVLVPWQGWPQSKHFLRFLMCGASMFGNVFLMLLGLSLTSPSMVALLQPTQPVFASILAVALAQEDMSVRKAIGVLLCVSGGMGAALSQHGRGHASVGIAVILAQCLSGANYVVQQRPLVQLGYSPIMVSGCSYTIASILTVLVGVVHFATMSEDDRASVKWWDSSPFFAYVLAFCVLFATVYNYVVMAFATGKLGATVVTLFLLLQGVFACAGEWIFFGHPVTWGQLAGSAAICAGLLVVVTAQQASYVDTRSAWCNAVLNPNCGPGQISESSEPEASNETTD